MFSEDDKIHATSEVEYFYVCFSVEHLHTVGQWLATFSTLCLNLQALDNASEQQCIVVYVQYLQMQKRYLKM